MTKPPRLTDLEDTANETPAQPAIPPGTKAKVRVDYETTVDPDLSGNQARRFNDELYDLAADRAIREREDEARPAELPFDPVTQFCSEWRNYAGWLLKVTRLPDPATRRMAGQSYNRTCLEIESLGSIPFDPANLEGILQIINGNSGGVFRIWLVDQNGQPLEDAFLDRVAIGDPPRQFGREHRPRYDYDGREYYAPGREPQQPTAPAKPSEPSALELRLQELQERLLGNALTRLMEQPQQQSSASASDISPEDRLTLLLVKEGNILGNVITKVAALAGSPEAAAVKETLSERALNAGLRIAETNPAIVERVSSTLERIVDRILPNTRAPVNIAASLQQPGTPQPQLTRPTQTAPTGLPEAPNPDDANDEEDPDVMDIIESLFSLLTDTRAFNVNDPVFIELGQAYPVKFRGAMQMIASLPLDSIIEWLKERSPLYESLLDSAITGPHYRKRLEALQVFCRTPAAPITTNDNSTPQTEDAQISPSTDAT